MRIAGATHTLGAPKEWDNERDGHCGRLAVRKVGNVYESAWELTPEEIEAINQGGHIVLRVVGGQPPVQLWVEPPRAEGE
jgi:hypothetical protein